MKVFIFMLSIIIVISTYTSIDNAQEFKVIIGKITNVALSSNPTTGYSWFLNLPNSNKLKVPDLNGEYKLLSGLTGGGGVQVFEISCSELCEDGELLSLAFEYKRPWEAEPIKTKVVTAKVFSNPEL
ncbi:unnamed protein product [Blepharisma stoltei]|uniref:Proteinase inhibitor I42 chagasin domain-containing protein n=1 Tax=Blepharisma stoltei TaxID=1481888 RepID=A0AAU9JZ45_9CILI|nr:unnamed protein product [Blepharisma stoltei]